MASTAPVCKINPPAEPVLPKPIARPFIPRATDLQSAIQAINAIAQAIQNINIVLNNLVNPGGGFTASNPNNQHQGQVGQPKLPNLGNFQENKLLRVTKPIRVYNPNDNTQYVDVNQITGLTFQDPTTGQQIQWSQ